ncbi:hypothetical protein [Jannaschia pohangensis]|uniref:Uncharacterized protein n=1 Tax=Jannaschia pohangensis TaxID=390807 RepID=A0A1I3UGT2_9RHOB|nr:hypothetical protein [Jannaschia pohangensis]SFJ80997.1 hypothetical protein SAMN04488095_3730 [Jannaschia pohangensis]
MANSKRRIVGVALAIAMVAVVVLRTKPDGDVVALRLGDNAYAVQQATGFPLGYPSQADGLSPVGGSRADVEATLDFGVLTLTCTGAYLEVFRTGDVVSGGRVFCPLDGSDGEPVSVLRDRAAAAFAWDRAEDFTASPRRAVPYGKTVAEAYGYLQSMDMTGTVMRVPLASWRQDRGLYLELNATRHARMGGVPSYEVSFSWSPPCLSTIHAAQLASTRGGATDKARADRAEAQVAEFCPDLPGSD